MRWSRPRRPAGGREAAKVVNTQRGHPRSARSPSPRRHSSRRGVREPPCRATRARTWPTANTRSTLCKWPRPRSNAGTSPLTSSRATWPSTRAASRARAPTRTAGRRCSTRPTRGGRAGSGCLTASASVLFSDIVTPGCSATSWRVGAHHWPPEQEHPRWGHDVAESGAVLMSLNHTARAGPPSAAG